MAVPTATYRIQLTPGFGFDAAAAIVPYLAELGISHLYLSPVLDAVEGSTHGYDVVDHRLLRPELGGADGFERLRATAEVHGLGIIVDVVPNHMAVPTPAWRNRQLWSVLRDGPLSPYAHWFDIDWTRPEHAVVMPVLGRRIGRCVADGEITVDTSGDEPVVRYYEHVFPVRHGTAELPLPQLLDRQWYRLAYWRVGAEELNYRRFFDVDTLAAVRVEEADVFDATHAILLDLVASGAVTGLRIDHPDGLADPRGYLARLAQESGGTWTVVEKILDRDEALPDDWRCAGTTGYDALAHVDGLFVDAAGAETLRSLYVALTDQPAAYAEVVEAAKRDVIAGPLRAEVAALVDLLVAIGRADLELRDHTTSAFEQAVTELLLAFEVYRAYVVPGESAPERSAALVTHAAGRARDRLREDHQDTLDVVVDLVLGRHGRSPDKDAFVVRFQQACGPVMAKGVEDTAGYRWFRLASRNEVGSDPERFGVSPDEFHAYARRQQERWPTTMTTLSTHDTKRAEDARARLAVLSELPDEWARTLSGWRSAAAAARPDTLDANTEYLVWQTLVAAAPITAERLWRYVLKAAREAKIHTSWTEPDEAYEAALRDFVQRVLGDEVIMDDVTEWLTRTAAAERANVLGQKLVQLTMPGVPDVYQGCELTNRRLVDPDNRRPVDFAAAGVRLARLDDGASPVALDDEKLLVTSRALRLRRDHPDWFGSASSYEPLEVRSEHLVGFVRSARVITLATRQPVGLAAAGGLGERTIALPPGTWTDHLSTRRFEAEPRLADVLDGLPVALLVRD